GGRGAWLWLPWGRGGLGKRGTWVHPTVYSVRAPVFTEASPQRSRCGLQSAAGFRTIVVPRGAGRDTLRGGEVVSRRAHNPKIAGSNPAPATKPSGNAIVTGGLFI